MYTFKGFISIPALVSNTDGITADVGELSSYGYTFSREIKTYSTVGSGVNVHCFSSRSSVMDARIAPPGVVTDLLKTLSAWVHQRQNGLAAAESISEFKLALGAQYPTEISDIVVPSMSVSITGHTYPTSISFTCTGYTAETNTVKLWFNSTAFLQEYDEYELVIVPPVANIDTLQTDYLSASAAIAAVDPAQTYALIQSARGSKPETLMISQMYSLVNKTNVTVSTKTYWTVLVYGPAGNSEDLIRAAVVAYLAANSTNALSKWKTILPDVFSVTEFMIVPLWNQYAVPPRTITPGIYSQACTVSGMLSYLKRVIPSYSGSHIDNHAQTIPHPYYNVLLACIGNLENRGAKYAVTDFHPDILSVGSTSTDFGRMSVSTQALLRHFTQMLMIAQSMTTTTDIPTAYKKSTRDGVLYITLTYEDVVYLVASKVTVPQS